MNTPCYETFPDGDLSGLTLSYREQRTNCILMDSSLFPTVDWPYLRIWAEDAGGQEQLYRVRLSENATATQGSFVSAQATFSLQGVLTAGDVVELAWLDEHYFHTILGTDTVASVLQTLSDNINALSTTVSSQHSGGAGTVTLTNLKPGEEGNRLGVIANVSGAQSETWSPVDQTMTGGASPTEWQVDLDFANLQDLGGNPIPTHNVRKMRWTYSAAVQQGAYSRSEFEALVSNWTVTGTNRTYQIAAQRSRRFEDNGALYSGAWAQSQGNFSGGTIQKTNQIGANVTVGYNSPINHRLYLGTRYTFESGTVSVAIDSDPPQVLDLFVPAEDFLARIDLGLHTPGPHTVVATLTGANAASADNSFYFDCVEEAIETTVVGAQAVRASETLATDWDTDHSLAVSPERVAWNLEMLGFKGLANHYAGAILFYELVNSGNAYSQGTITFQGAPVFSQNVQVVIDGTVFSRLTLSTDTIESVTKAFEFLINDGATGVRASASGDVLTIFARIMGTAGDSLTLSASPACGSFQAIASGPNLSGGVDGQWITDTNSLPRLNRAARDWHRAYFLALKTRGIDAVAAFSMELSHADDSLVAGLAQRYPDGSPVLLTTPAVQTNFSPTSLDFWKQAYLEMAQMQDEALTTPYLQFGEVQWWYFSNASGMTFYDDYTKTEFQTQHGRAIHTFTSNDDSPDPFPEEKTFLPSLIGSFTSAIRSFVLATYPQTKFEVLYPHDVNDHLLTRAVNYSDADWTSGNLEVLKTENFTYTGSRDMNKALESIRFPQQKGFAVGQAAHLVGVFNASEPWNWERRLSRSEGVTSVVFWAFDQFSMIGYSLPLYDGVRRAQFLGRA